MGFSSFVDIDTLFESGFLSARARTVCVRADIYTAGEINYFFHKHGTFLKIRNCGIATNEELIKIACSIETKATHSSENKSKSKTYLETNIAQNIFDFLLQNESLYVTEVFIKSKQSITDILNNQEKILNNISKLPGMGKTKISRIKFILNQTKMKYVIVCDFYKNLDENKKIFFKKMTKLGVINHTNYQIISEIDKFKDPIKYIISSLVPIFEKKEHKNIYQDILFNKNYSQIGKQYNLSKERVRQISKLFNHQKYLTYYHIIKDFFPPLSNEDIIEIDIYHNQYNKDFINSILMYDYVIISPIKEIKQIQIKNVIKDNFKEIGVRKDIAKQFKRLLITIYQRLLINNFININKLKTNFEIYQIDVFKNNFNKILNCQLTSFNDNYIYNHKLNVTKIIEEYIETRVTKAEPILDPSSIFKWAKINFPKKKIKNKNSISSRFNELEKIQILALGKSGKFKVNYEKKIKSLHTKDICVSFLRSSNYPLRINSLEKKVLEINQFIKEKVIRAVLSNHKDIFRKFTGTGYVGLYEKEYLEIPIKMPLKKINAFLSKNTLNTNWISLNLLHVFINKNTSPIHIFQIKDYLYENNYFIVNGFVSEKLKNHNKKKKIVDVLGDKKLENIVKDKYINLSINNRISFKKKLKNLCVQIYQIEYSDDEILKIINYFLMKK